VTARVRVKVQLEPNHMFRLPLTLAGLLVVSVSAGIGQQPTSGMPTTVIRANVHLVVLHATVTDDKGEVVSGLSEQAFRLLVDNQPHPISVFRGEDMPVAVGLVVDHSESMAPMWPNVVAAALGFLRVSNPDDQMFVVDFSNQIRLGLPSGKTFTNSASELQAALLRYPPGGSTALYDAIGVALAHVEKATITKQALLIITDGGDNSSRARLNHVLDWARKASVTLYCIGLYNGADSDRNPQVLKDLADATGGKALFPSTASDTSSVCVKLAKDIRSQYTLAFNGAQDGKYHPISLTVQDRGRGLTVRTRTGYQAGTP